MLDRKLYRIKSYPRGYKKKLKRINKTRERFNVANYIQEVFEDLTDYNFFGTLYKNNQVINSWSDLLHSEFMTDAEYHMFEHDQWLKYLGQTWTLDDESDYCDKVNDAMPKEYKLLNELQVNCSKSFTEEEINYYTNSFKKAFDTEETDPIKRAMNVLQAVRDYQQAWQKYGTKGRVALYFGVTDEQEAQEWLEEFCKDID